MKLSIFKMKCHLIIQIHLSTGRQINTQSSTVSTTTANTDILIHTHTHTQCYSITKRLFTKWSIFIETKAKKTVKNK